MGLFSFEFVHYPLHDLGFSFAFPLGGAASGQLDYVRRYWKTINVEFGAVFRLWSLALVWFTF